MFYGCVFSQDKKYVAIKIPVILRPFTEGPERVADDQHPLDKRLDAIGWALFLIMIGGLWLAPKELIPEGAWLIGVGLIILGVNAVRYVNAIKVSGFWIVVGIIALVAGASDFYGVDLPLFPILLILIGVGIIIGVLTEKKPS